jgi:hypothetical protein
LAEVEYNDGEFAEAQTNGIEGIEKDLLLGALQIHREDTDDTPDEFQRRFPVGMLLEIVTTTEITIKPSPPDSMDSILQSAGVNADRVN